MPRVSKSKKQIEVVNIDEDYFTTRNEIEDKPKEEPKEEPPPEEPKQEPTEAVRMKKPRTKKPKEEPIIEEPEEEAKEEQIPESIPEPTIKPKPLKVMCQKCGKLVSPKTLNYTHQYQCKAIKQEPKIVSKKIVKTIKYLDNKNEIIKESPSISEEESDESEEVEQAIPKPTPAPKPKAKAKAKATPAPISSFNNRSRYSDIRLF